MKKMCCLKKMLAVLCAALCLAVPFLAGAAETGLVEVTNEPLPDASSNDLPEAPYPGWIDYAMGGACYYLVEAAKDTVVYAVEGGSPYDALEGKSPEGEWAPFVELKAGDPLMMCYHPGYRGFGDDEWICVVLEPTSFYFRRGYVRAADLKKNEEGEIARKKLASHTESDNEFDAVWSKDGAVPITTEEGGGETLATLREGIVLPAVWDEKLPGTYGGWARVPTYDGMGYVVDESIAVMSVVTESGGDEEIIGPGEEEGDVQDGTENTPLEDHDETPDEGEDDIPEEGDMPDESVDVPKTGDAAPAAGLALLFGLALCAFALKKAGAK